MSAYRIGPVHIDVEARQITRSREAIALEPRAFDALIFLIENRERVVTKDQLIREVWRDRVVTDAAVSQAIAKIRKVFGGDTQSVITTASRVGYRFVGTLESSRDRRSSKWWQAAAAVAVIAVAVLAFSLTVRQAPPPPNSIAVLPLLDLSADQSLGYFADGLADELLSELARLPALQVVARTSSFALRDREMDAREIGEVLGVAAVLEGSLRIEDGRMRITAQLIDTENGLHLWTDSYDRDYVGLLEIQREIAAAIATELRAELTDPAGRSLLAAPPRNLNAFEAYLKGRHLWRQRGEAALREAIGLFQDAIRADPGFARAHEALASAYVVLPEWAQVSRTESEALAIAAAREALRLDDRLGEARAILATRAGQNGDWAQARRLYEEAIEREPSNPTLLHWYAAFLNQVGQPEQALEPANLALTLDPLSPMTHNVFAWTALLNDDSDGAWEHAGQAVSLGLLSARMIAAAAAARRGEREAAAEQLAALPNPAESIMACAEALKTGKPGPARAKLRNDPRSDSLALIDRTLCMGLLGFPEDALTLHAFQEQWTVAGALLWLPEFSSVRDTPEFEALMTRHRLTQYWQSSAASPMSRPQPGT